MADDEVKSVEVLISDCADVKKKDDKEDSVDYCIEELEKALENSKCDDRSDDDAITGMKTMRTKRTSESTEHTFIVVDECEGSERSIAVNENAGSCSSLMVVDELLNELDSFSQDSSDGGDLTVIHNAPRKCDDGNNLDVSDECNKDVPIFLSDTICDKQLSDEKFVIGTPTFINNTSKFNTMKSRNVIATSTPCRQNDRDCDMSSVYMPPARSILEKWKSSCFQQSQMNSTQDQGISDISAIECADTPKNVTSNTPNQSTVCHEKTDFVATKNEFEEAFHNLYMTLFGDMEETNDRLFNSNVKLKMYHDSIIKQHEQDNVKFNEIISEISSKSNKTFIKVNDNTNIIDNKTELLTIKEETDESVEENKTVIPNIITEKVDVNVKKEPTVENEVNTIIENQSNNECDKNKTEIKKVVDNYEELLEKEILEVPVINGANSIIYQNSRELTLDEEEALLNDDPDVISLECSDINSGAPSTASSSFKSDRAADLIIPSEVQTDSNTGDVKVFIVSPEVVSAEISTAPVQIPSGVVEDKSEPPVQDRNAVFVSDNPEENDDNNDPEWEHLRRLSNDKERYKALRERWHSIVIPDPNLDLTSQTFRKRRIARMKGNRKPVNDNDSENNNGEFNRAGSRKRPLPLDSDDDSFVHGGQGHPKRRKLCTLLFEQNIEALMKKLEYKRYRILEERDKDLSMLAVKQEQEYNAGCVASYNYPRHVKENLLSELYARQMRDVCCLRRRFDERLKMAEAETQEYISALNAATDEVLTFHKFYQDLDSANNNTSSSMYLSDKQIQELVETEYMLELYSKFYKF